MVWNVAETYNAKDKVQRLDEWKATIIKTTLLANLGNGKVELRRTIV